MIWTIITWGLLIGGILLFVVITDGVDSDEREKIWKAIHKKRN